LASFDVGVAVLVARNLAVAALWFIAARSSVRFGCVRDRTIQRLDWRSAETRAIRDLACIGDWFAAVYPSLRARD
jgi:hypothetical protein